MFCDDSILPILILLLCGCCNDSGSSPFGCGASGRGDKSTTLAMCLCILLLCCNNNEPDGPPLI